MEMSERMIRLNVGKVGKKGLDFLWLRQSKYCNSVNTERRGEKLSEVDEKHKQLLFK